MKRQLSPLEEEYKYANKGDRILGAWGYLIGHLIDDIRRNRRKSSDKPMHKSTDSNQKKRWKDNAR